MSRISILLNAAESDMLECKEVWSDDCLKALAAIANTRGGVLLVGIADDRRRIPGWIGDGKQQEKISNQITSVLGVHPLALIVDLHDGVPVLLVQMPRAVSPVSVRGRYYRRIGNSTRELPAEELPRFLLERTGQSWDTIPTSLDLSAVSTRALDEFRLRAQERLPALSALDGPKEILGKLKLLTNEDCLLRGAVLLFGLDPQRLSPSIQLQIGQFGPDGQILDDKRAEGTLFQQLDVATDVLRRHLFVRYNIPEQMEERRGVIAFQRQEVWEYPLAAVREAIINALIHRDYTSHGRVQVRICEDRLIVSNPGGLIGGMTVEDLSKDPHDSFSRNPVLAQIFYYASLVEQWGTGTTRMIRSCERSGLPKPVFEASPSGFTVTFFKDPLNTETLRKLGMSERKIGAIRYIQTHGRISSSEYGRLANISQSTATRDLQDLVIRGILEREGFAGRNVYYRLSHPT